MEKGKKEQERIESQTVAAVTKILTKRQRSIYQAMLGPPFDLTKLGGPGFGGPGGRGPGGRGGGGAATKKAAVAKAGGDSDDDAGGAGASPAAAAKPSAPAASSKRKSLAESRGLPDDKPDDQ
jgi:hypothetical protein